MVPPSISPKGFDQVRQLRYRLCLPAVLGFQSLAVYDTVRSAAWRQENYGPDALQDCVVAGYLAASISYQDIIAITGIGQGRVSSFLRQLIQLGWLKKEKSGGKGSAGAATSAVYILGNLCPDLGGGTETLFADVVTDNWYEEIDALCLRSSGTRYKKLKAQDQQQKVREYLHGRYPFLQETSTSKKVNRTPSPHWGNALHVDSDAALHERSPNGATLGGGLHVPLYVSTERSPVGATLGSTTQVRLHGGSPVSDSTLTAVAKCHVAPTGRTRSPNGATLDPLDQGLSARNHSGKSVKRPRTYRVFIENSSTTLRSTLRTTYSESSCTPCSSSGLSPLIMNSSSAPDRLRHDATPTTHPVPLAPPAFPAGGAQSEGACVTYADKDGETMAFRRAETGLGASQWSKSGFGRSGDDYDAPKGVSERPPPMGLESKVASKTVTPPRSAPARQPKPVVERVSPPRPKTAAEGVSQLASEIEQTKADSRAAAEAALKKDRAKKQKRDNLSSDKSYAAQKSAAQEIEQVWRDEMRIVFPDLPQIAWFKREGFKLIARKEGKLAADLLDGYDGDVGVVSSMVESFLRNWGVFGPMLTKQEDSIPTFGLLYACHASVAAESIKLRKRSEVIERYQAWERENAGNAFAVPPADLEAAYRAATAKPKGKR